MASARPRRLPVPPRRPGPADAGEHRRGGLSRHPRRQDRLLPQRRHPGVAREPLAADVGRLTRSRAGPRERRRPARRQTRHREVPARLDGPRRRSALPQSGLPDLREPDRVPRRRRQTVRLRAGREELPARLRRDRSRHHPRTKLLIFNNLHNPTGAESPDEEIAALAELALRHDLYVLSDEAYWDVRYSGRSRRSPRSPAWPSGPSSCTPSARSTR